MNRWLLKMTFAFIWGLSLSAQAVIVDQNPGYVSYFSGRVEDVHPKTWPSLLLFGGGDERDVALQWFVDRAGHGDIVIIRASGTDDYNDWLLAKGADSVETFVFSDRKAAFNEAILRSIENAEGIFIAGGDQSNYVKFFSNTPFLEALNRAIKRGAPFGGTSAGLAVLGNFLFSAMNDTITSSEALLNPFDTKMTLGKDFISAPILRDVITDSHFMIRERMGRLVAFMARIYQDGWSSHVRGIGVDENVGLGIDENFVGQVFAANPKVGANDDLHQFVYFLDVDHGPQRCRAGETLTYEGIRVQKIGRGNLFDLKNWKAIGGETFGVSVKNGVLTRDESVLQSNKH